MNCKVLVSLFFIFCMVAGITQTTDSTAKRKRFDLCLLSGVSQPFGQFATYRQRENEDQNTGFTYAGAPKKGFAFQLCASYSFRKYWGVTGSFLSTYNETLALKQADVYPYKSSGLGGGSSVTAMNYWAGTWRSNNLMFGVYANTDGPIRIKLKIMAGVQSITCPEVKISGTGYNWSMSSPTVTYYTYSTTQFKSITTAFVFSSGLELQQNVWKNIFVKISADVLLSHTHFNLHFSSDYNDGTSNSYTASTYSNTVTKNISFLCLSAGVGYSF